MINLILYGTLGCHLCEVAEQILATELDLNAMPVELVDIADHDHLVERYGIRIPVLLEPNSGAELGWPFDAEQLQDFISRLQPCE